MHFTKMNGLGNDYIFIEEREINQNLTKTEIRSLCDRHFGIGGDGVVILRKSDRSDVIMQIYNADGSEAETCGNALRCTATLLKEKIKKKRTFTIETKAGIVLSVVHTDQSVSITMGSPIVDKAQIRSFGITGYLVNVGNPHFVIICNTKNEMNNHFDRYAKDIANDISLFPERVNVEVAFIQNNEAFMRVYERGTGETMACGTGATAVYAVCRQLGTLPENCSIHLPGGSLQFSMKNEQVVLTGIVSKNYIGQINLPQRQE